MISAVSQIQVDALLPYYPGTSPSQRFRIEQWSDELAVNGVRVHLIPFADMQLMRLLHKSGHWKNKIVHGISASLRRFLYVFAKRRSHAVFIHRAMYLAGPPVLERLIRFLRRPIIFDFDDAIFHLHTSSANRRWGWLKWPGKTSTLCRLAQHVVVGNEYLAEYARKHNSKVTIVPSSVDTEKFLPGRNKQSGQQVVIGWTGSSTSQTYLEWFAPVLAPIAKRAEVEFRVHSDRKPDLPFPFTWRPWSPDTEVTELDAFDIGIMPMPDDRWARGKCAMKALLYMAMETSAVCSAIGTNCEVIQHGENGMLAGTPEEWHHCLSVLIEDVKLRNKLGQAGRQTVEANYSKRVCAERLAAVIREVVDR